MIDVETLTQAEERFQPIIAQANGRQIESAQTIWLAAGLSVHRIRGEKSRSAADLFDEFQMALEFPTYFGHNWDAFSDCITDLSWLQAGAGIVLLVTEPGEVLREPGNAELSRLVRLLDAAANEWGRSVSEGQWWDRPPVPFHVVLACEPGEVETARQRWVAAGASVADATSNF